MKYLTALLFGVICLGQAYALPYRIPAPTYESCSNQRVYEELSQHLGDGTLFSDDDLLSSLSFVEDCETLLRARSGEE